MSGAIHQSYIRMFEEMQEEQAALSAPRRVEAVPHWENYTRPSIPQNERRPVVQPSEGKVSWLHLVAIAVALFVAGVSIEEFYRWRYSTIEVAKVEVKPEDKSEDVNRQMELVKRILVSLVGTVDELSTKVGAVNAESSAPPSSELSAYRVLVTAQRANLREFPSADSRSVMIVPKDTELFGTEIGNGWLKVTTPLGQEAWILKELVSVQEL